ncbi:MAG: 3-oxoacyl-[acyl-carrier-protein] reductase FabG [Chlamydiae bacterium]|nr:3-oxoacyl-[acyl-carrier-protein] reductase FabG [Chlamydiota bacterium]
MERNFMTLKDQNVIVTGGTAGIGKAIALHFAKQGANVAIFGTNPERGELVVNEIKEQSSGKVTFTAVDVSKTEKVKVAVDQVLVDFGSIDILINNAGIVRDGLLLRMSEDDWDRVLEVNLKSVYNTCKAVIRPMMKAKKGKIINISSVIGLTGNAGQVNYAASKSGIIGVTKSLAKELAGRNIYVNCIAPGFIETSMTSELNEVVKDEILRNIPLKRIGRPEEIANAALFLASEGANYITGQVLPIDGGMTM